MEFGTICEKTTGRKYISLKSVHLSIMSRFIVRKTFPSTSTSTSTSTSSGSSKGTWDIENVEFKFPSNICFGGTTGSGKTKLLLHFLRLHKHNFDKLFVFCGLGAISGDYDWTTKIFQPDDIKSIAKIMNMQEQLWRQGLQYNVMIIFDDFVGTLSMIGGKGGKLIDKLISSGRHIGISVAFRVWWGPQGHNA